MQRKHLLVAASAAAMALGLATQASASITLAFGPSGTPPGATTNTPGDSGDISNTSDLLTSGPNTGQYEDAVDGVFPVGGQQGILAMDITFDTNELPSDTTVLTISFGGNGTFGIPLSGANVTFVPAPGGSCASDTDFLFSGGGASNNSAKYSLSNSNATCRQIHLEIPVNETTSAADESVTVTLVGASSGINYGTSTLNVIHFAKALSATTVTELNDNHRLTYASLMDHRTLGPDHKLGDAGPTLDLHDHYDLMNGEFVNGDLTATTLKVTGGFATINPALSSDSGPGTLGTCVVDPSQTFCLASSTGAGQWQYDVDLATLAGLPVISMSNYSATISGVLNHSIYTPGSPFSFTGPLNNLGWQGAIAIVPWTASNAQAALTGSANVVRISNIGSGPTGPVTALVLASTCHPATGPAPCTSTDPVVTASTSPVTLTSSIAAGTEYLVDLGAIATGLGEFGRGDLELIVAADPRTITLKKEIVKNGNISDQALGTFADGEAGSLLVGSEEIAPAVFQDSTNDGENPGNAPGTGVNPATGVGGNALNPYSLSGIPFVSFIPDSQPNQTPVLPPPF